MENAATKFWDYVSKVKLNSPRAVQFISSMTGLQETDKIATVDYWVEQIINPVKFLQAIETIFTLTKTPNISVAIEFESDVTLINMSRRIIPNRNIQWLSSTATFNIIQLDGIRQRSNETLNNTKRTTLFNPVSIPWSEPVSDAPLKMAQELDVLSCAYDTEWVPLIQDTSYQNIIYDFVVISTKNTNLIFPDNWKFVYYADKNAMQLDLVKKEWIHTVFISNGSEEDVHFGLKLLQIIGSNAQNQKQKQKVCFAIKFGSVADAGLLGLARSFRLEYPNNVELKCLIYQSKAKLTEGISKCFNINNENDFLINDKGNISVLRLRHCTGINISGESEVNPDSSYIITGGQGSLGMVMVDLLVQQGAQYILLLSRSEMKPEVETELIAWRKRSRIELLSCDVSQEDDVHAVKVWLKNKNWPDVSGIIHTAGILNDSIIQNQSVEKLEIVYNAKVKGAYNLRNTFAPKDFLLLFSSAVSIFGSVGQANYVAANATLDALALQWSNMGEPVLSIQWGAWSEAGMAVRHSAVENVESLGFGSISNKLGQQVVKQLLSSKKQGVVCISPINWENVRLNNPLISLFRKKLNEETLDNTDVEEFIHKAMIETLGRNLSNEDSLLARKSIFKSKIMR